MTSLARLRVRTDIVTATIGWRKAVLVLLTVTPARTLAGGNLGLDTIDGDHMRLPIKAGDVPGRVTTGAYILHAGWEKWQADDDRAGGVHGMAAGAFPVLAGITPRRFLRVLAASEITIGAALLIPAVPSAVAAAGLTGFSGSLLAMYARTPALRKPGSIWPSQAGTAVSKDIWMLGIGLGLLTDTLARRGFRSSDAERI